MDTDDAILVVNPNSSERISAQIAEAVAGDAGVQVVTSPDGPPAIESDEDVVASVVPMIDTARAHKAAAVVVACFSDPGLDELRRESTVPVFGIAESALHKALAVGERVGVISSVDESVPRHLRYYQKLGLEDQVVADLPLGIGVLELDTEAAFDRASAVGRELVSAGADVVVLGCTGMTHMQARLEEAIGVPTVDPCLAAVEAAREAVEVEPA